MGQKRVQVGWSSVPMDMHDNPLPIHSLWNWLSVVEYLIPGFVHQLNWVLFRKAELLEIDILIPELPLLKGDAIPLLILHVLTLEVSLDVLDRNLLRLRRGLNSVFSLLQLH